MNNKILSAKEIYDLLIENGLLNYKGNIKFKLGNTEAIIKAKDTIGNSLQSWLGQWLEDNNIYYSEPNNTQEFPDFYLHPTELNSHMMELKTFNYEASPAFDIANFESYCQSLRTKPFRLDADYLILGYSMDSKGEITIKDMWLKKIWEIAGKSERYPLRTQIKRDMIYNIRPIIWYSNADTNRFKSKEEFVEAIYFTLKSYKGSDFAINWLKEVKENYKKFYSKEIDVNF